jgi:hypothetical protein
VHATEMPLRKVMLMRPAAAAAVLKRDGGEGSRLPFARLGTLWSHLDCVVPLITTMSPERVLLKSDVDWQGLPEFRLNFSTGSVLSVLCLR